MVTQRNLLKELNKIKEMSGWQEEQQPEEIGKIQRAASK
jgi:hypothetical protein